MDVRDVWIAGSLAEARPATTTTVYVIATGEEGTRAALERAHRIATRMNADVELLVPRIVRFGVPLSDVLGEGATAEAPYRALVWRSKIPARIHLCACREPRHVPRQLLLDHAHIVIGGRRRHWRRSAEERLAHALRKPSGADEAVVATIETSIAATRRLDDLSGSRVAARPASAGIVQLTVTFSMIRTMCTSGSMMTSNGKASS